MKKLIPLALVLISTVVSWGQPSSDISLTQYQKAISRAKSENNAISLNKYLNGQYLITRDFQSALKLAQSYYELRDYGNAKIWFEKASSLPNAKLDHKSQLQYLEVLKTLGMYQELNNELDLLKKPLRDDELTRIKLLTDGTDLFKQLASSNATYEIKPLGKGVNTLLADDNIFIQDHILYYVSGRTNGSKNPQKKREIEKAVTILNMAEFDNDGTLLNVMPTTFPFIDGTSNVGGITMDHSQNLLYLIEHGLEGNKMVKSELYLVTKKDDRWSKKKKISIAGLDFIKDPSIHEINGSKFLFFSAKESMQSDFDLYYSEIAADGSLNKAIELIKLNTSFDDCSPVLHENMLWFSSKGFPSIGGTDIHYVEFDNMSISSEVQNAGLGINTTYDESSIDFLDKKRMIVSSNRIGTKSVFSPSTCNDLFLIERSQSDLSLQTGVRYHNDWLIGANLNLEEEVNGQFSTTMIFVQNSKNPIDIKLLPNRSYRISASHDGFHKEVIVFNTFEPLDSRKLSGMLDLEKKDPEDKHSTLVKNKPFVLNNIQFERNDYRLTISGEKELDRVFDLMKTHDHMQIRIEAHTDSQGEAKYNLNLSNRRAQACKSYLVTKGIQPTRIQTKGFGERHLLNHCTDGISCSDMEHAANRRVSITITKGPDQIMIKEKSLTNNGKLKTNSNIESLDHRFPKIEILNNNQEFGPIVKGDVIKGAFMMINSGNSKLEIELASGCDCTELDWPRLPIAPGEEFEISFIYDSGKKESIEDNLDKVVVDIVANTEEQYIEAYFTVKFKN